VQANGNSLARNTIETDCIGFGVWDCKVGYGTDPDKDKKQPKFQFDTTGGTCKVTNSIQTIQSYAPPGQTPPNHNGAIGVTKDGIEGVEIQVPVLKFTETHQLPASLVNWSYRKDLAALTGHVNDAPWRTFDAGEVMFGGCAGGSQGQDIVEVTFTFYASRNVDDLTVGSITGISKDGWDYLWVEYEDNHDAAAGLVKNPIAVHIERVYFTGDFSTLRIPNAPV
jgi:hypothetical protein